MFKNIADKAPDAASRQQIEGAAELYGQMFSMLQKNVAVLGVGLDRDSTGTIRLTKRFEALPDSPAAKLLTPSRTPGRKPAGRSGGPAVCPGRIDDAYTRCRPGNAGFLEGSHEGRPGPVSPLAGKGRSDARRQPRLGQALSGHGPGDGAAGSRQDPLQRRRGADANRRLAGHYRRLPEIRRGLQRGRHGQRRAPGAHGTDQPQDRGTAGPADHHGLDKEHAVAPGPRPGKSGRDDEENLRPRTAR